MRHNQREHAYVYVHDAEDALGEQRISGSADIETAWVFWLVALDPGYRAPRQFRRPAWGAINPLQAVLE